MVDHGTGRLLGGHVRGRAHQERRWRSMARAPGTRAEPEVGDLRPVEPALQQDVPRLDVAVDQALHRVAVARPRAIWIPMGRMDFVRASLRVPDAPARVTPATYSMTR